MKKSLLIIVVFLFLFASITAQEENEFTRPLTRDVIVSHTDENGILQLYRKQANGKSSKQITYSAHGCQMPSCSPDGKKIAYVEQHDNQMTLRVSDIDGENAETLIKQGFNLLPCWAPDSKHIVWMKVQPQKNQEPARNSQLHIINIGSGQSRVLFTDGQQLKFSNSMPSVSPKGNRIAFVSNRDGPMRIWVSNLEGSDAKAISTPTVEYHEAIGAPIEQKVPAWSPDGKWIAHWEGVEMTHMSKFTGKPNPKRDQMISETFQVWIAGSNGTQRQKIGKGDDPTWSPDGFATRAFPNPKRGCPQIMLETESGSQELPIVPDGKQWGRFTWVPK